ncbi:putative ribonuclease H-like domain-containing protein [Tanacetum coccineum]
MKGLSKEFSLPNPQQNEVAERKNRTLIEAARTMLADSLLPTSFWAKAVSTACCVHNRVLVTKPHNKDTYELLLSIPPSKAFRRLYGCPLTNLNTLDPLANLNGKLMRGSCRSLSKNSNTFRVFNTRTRKGKSDRRSILSMNSILLPLMLSNSPLSSSSQSTDNKDADEVPGKGDDDLSERNGQEKEEGASNKEDDQHVQDFRAELDNLLVQQKKGYANNTNRVSTINPSVSAAGQGFDNADDQERIDSSTQDVNTVGPSINTASENINTGSSNINTASPIPNDPSMQSLEATGIFDDAYDDREEVGAEADLNNLETTMIVSFIPTTRIHKDDPIEQIIRDLHSALLTRRIFQVTPKVSHLHAAKRIFRYLKGQPKLGLLYPKDSPFNLKAYTDSDYVGASLDRKSTTRGCQFLGSRLILGQCKKQTIVANSTTEFWETTSTRILDNGEVEITATIDGKVKIFIEASIRRHLKLEDSDGSTVSVESHHTPTGAPSTSPPQISPTLRSSIRQETEVPQPSSPPHTNVADEAASTGVDVRHRGAATTVTSLDAGHGSGNIDKTSSMPHDSPLPRGHTLGSDEGRMQHNKLMDLVTKLSDRVIALETDLQQTKKVYGAAFTKLIKKGRKIDEIDQDPDIYLVQHDTEFNFDFNTAKEVSTAEADISTTKPVSSAGAAITTASVVISTASPTNVSTAEDITMAESLVYIRRSAEKTKDKAELEEEERQRIARVHESASSFNVEEWEDIKARVKADEELAQKLQTKEREKYSEVEQARMLIELINQRKKYFAAKRAEERRNKPPT